MPPVTQALIVVNCLAYLAGYLLGPSLLLNFALWPLDSPGGRAPSFQIWQLVTYGFLHGGFLHLLVNMYALYLFGGELEKLWGSRRYMHLFFASVVAAAVAQLAFSSVADLPPYPTVGASGGVFGLLLAYAVYFPRRVIMLLIPPVPLPAWLFVSLYGILELFLGVTGTQAGVAHFAHLGGMAGAWLVIAWWRGSFPFSRH